MSLQQARTISVSIDRDRHDVYDFIAAPENMAQWAAGLGAALARSGDEWTAEDPGGARIRIRFTESNAFGVVDHTVIAPDGTESHNAFRVAPNGSGAEVLFTVLRRPGMTDEEFDADASAVRRDLEGLKALLER